MTDEIFAVESARRLELQGNVRHLRLAALAEPAPAGYRWRHEAPLYAVRFTGAPARVDADGERLRLRYAGWLWPLHGTRATDLALHPHVRWRISARGGLARAELDLSRLHVDGLDIHGGLDRVDLRLPTPAAELPLHIRGGATRLRVACPPGVALRVRVDGGVQRLRIDTLRVDSVGGRFAWETPDYAANPRRIDLRLRSGAHDLAVDTPDLPTRLDAFAPTRLAVWPRLFGAP